MYSLSPFDNVFVINLNLQLSSNLDEEYLVIKGKNVAWYRPNTFTELLSLKEQHPQAKIICGNTEIGAFSFYLKHTFNKDTLILLYPF